MFFYGLLSRYYGNTYFIEKNNSRMLALIHFLNVLQDIKVK